MIMWLARAYLCVGTNSVYFSIIRMDAPFLPPVTLEFSGPSRIWKGPHELSFHRNIQCVTNPVQRNNHLVLLLLIFLITYFPKKLPNGDRGEMDDGYTNILPTQLHSLARYKPHMLYYVAPFLFYMVPSRPSPSPFEACFRTHFFHAIYGLSHAYIISQNLKL
jgi:hypothetical protein